MAAPSAGTARLASGLRQYNDVVVVLGVVLVVVMMVLPLPAPLLDVLLATNISLALLILLLTMNVAQPLQFAVFPSLLLITTLFRLALNVSSTRLILLHGYAGQMIQAFGEFVVGGNPLVGLVVFLILVAIQFIVITRGAERVAEVAARFTLDAMPGKQMSIDADLNAGLIDQEEARRRRQEIEREADFYGAMDGASKFVKGDAVAGIVITLINILGGFAVGVGQRGLSLAEAVQRYTLLTVGDGLVTQIPALLISTATGILITRAASDNNLGRDLSRQLLGQPRVLGVAGMVILALAVVPGLPTLPFLALAGLMGGLGYVLYQRARRAAVAEVERQRQRELDEARKPESVLNLLQIDTLELEIGYSLIPLVDASQGGDLLERITLLRRQLALELGLVVPPIRIRDNMQLPPSVYVIKVKGVEVGRGELMVGHLLAMDPGLGGRPPQGSLPTTEPAFGLPAWWVRPDQRDAAELAGFTVVDLPSVVATHLTEVIRRHAADLLGRQDVRKLLDHVKSEQPALVDELVPDLLALADVQKVLQNLLREGVPIRNLPVILEALADAARITKDPEMLTEHVREALAPQLSRLYRSEQGFIPAIAVPPQLEEALVAASQRTERGLMLLLEPARAEAMLRRVAEALERASSQGYQPVLLCAPAARLALRRLLGRSLARVPVLSYGELTPDAEVRVVGTVSWTDEG